MRRQRLSGIPGLAFTLGVVVVLCTCASPNTGADHIKADPFEITIDSFGRFVAETGYQTTADSLGWSGVFDTATGRWDPVEGAQWLRPTGAEVYAGSYPVTQVSYFDACAYCAWKGGRLPSAAEWDRMAGDRILPGNIWQGPFPHIDQGSDGFAKKVAPVGQYEPTPTGLHDLFGNVWEWTSSEASPGVMIIKGGSFLCDASFCSGYYPDRYQTTPKDSGLNHLGFRCVYDN